MRSLVVGVSLTVGGILGGLIGGLLSAYWWDFPREDVEYYGEYIVPFYSALGVVLALLIVGLLIAVVSVVVELRARRHNRADTV